MNAGSNNRGVTTEERIVLIVTLWVALLAAPFAVAAQPAVRSLRTQPAAKQKVVPVAISAALPLAEVVANLPLPPGVPFARGHSSHMLAGRRLVIPGDFETHALGAPMVMVRLRDSRKSFPGLPELSPRENEVAGSHLWFKITDNDETVFHSRMGAEDEAHLHLKFADGTGKHKIVISKGGEFDQKIVIHTGH